MPLKCIVSTHPPTLTTVMLIPTFPVTQGKHLVKMRVAIFAVLSTNHAGPPEGEREREKYELQVNKKNLSNSPVLNSKLPFPLL